MHFFTDTCRNMCSVNSLPALLTQNARTPSTSSTNCSTVSVRHLKHGSTASPRSPSASASTQRVQTLHCSCCAAATTSPISSTSTTSCLQARAWLFSSRLSINYNASSRSRTSASSASSLASMSSVTPPASIYPSSTGTSRTSLSVLVWRTANRRQLQSTSKGSFLPTDPRSTTPRAIAVWPARCST